MVCLVKRIFGLVICASIPAAVSAQPVEPQGTRCVVGSISDGDTFRCVGGGRWRIRLLLIDTPERDQAPFGGLAAKGLHSLIPPGDTVHLEFDVQRYDRYRRTLAYVYLRDGRMVNEEMARLGLAVVTVYPPNVRHVERIRKAAAEARERKVGLWRTSAFDCLPAEHRARRC